MLGLALDILIQLIQVLGGYRRPWTGVDNAGTSFGLFPIRKVEFESGDNTSVGHLPTVLHNVHTKLENVSAANFTSWRLLGAFAESLIINKCPVARLCVLEVELAILIPE